MNAYRLGRYELLGELGRGAMGVVYRARDPIIDRIVALKTIDLALTGAALASFEERFFQEARSAGRLNHPNIVTIYDAGKADGVAYIAMEFLEGTSLREILDEQPPLPIPRILEITGQVARGLAYAHEHGVVHRDIKPANVIVLRNRRPKLTDFGIARLGEAEGIGSERAGSPKYMSPEQIRGDVSLDGRSDLFSLGTVLYEMLTGRQPFTGDTVTDIMRQVLEHTPPVPSVVDGHVPPELDGIVMRMLAKRPEDRFPSVRSLFRELRRLEENSSARGAESARGVVDTRADPESQAAPVTPAPSQGDRTLVMADGRERTDWRRAAVIGGVVVAIAAAAMIPLKLQFADANATREGASKASTPVAAVTPIAPAVDLAPEKPPEIAPAPEPPKPPARPARKAAPKPPPVVVEPPPPPPVQQAAVQPPPPPAPRAPETATLLLSIQPWGEIYIDGKRHGTTPPLATLEVPPGSHHVEIRNPAQPSYFTNISVRAGDTHRIQHIFRDH
jgi:predicted Ser/Thr protein kinase